jgi:ferredoxin
MAGRRPPTVKPNEEGQLMETRKIAVFPERCIAAGNCYEIAPKYFDQDTEDGTVVQLRANAEGGDESLVARAAATCPVAAIQLGE